ncbi:uncharacterized protein LOC125779486 [Bactrocera dorsalis]|uniref:Uncharacterized protein LOC125779486 n=1 Tax=Bactrocera dorsalis TaxID=27457 RepID=A0ABM3K5P4_BACDO|nr:uncharacterized protein LOC125779486 [Bactrocera dorsalis]
MEVKKKIKAKGTFRWSESQTKDLLINIVDAIKENPEHFEKPTAQRFYNKIGEKAPHLMNIKWDIMRIKMKYLKTTFLSALKWKSQTGAGLLESADPRSVEEYIKRICPFYEDLQVIFERRISVQPPAIYQSTELVSALDDTYMEYITPEIDPDTSSSSLLPSPSVIMYPSADEVVSPSANFACTSTPRRNMKRVQIHFHYFSKPKIRSWN